MRSAIQSVLRWTLLREAEQPEGSLGGVLPVTVKLQAQTSHIGETTIVQHSVQAGVPARSGKRSGQITDRTAAFYRTSLDRPTSRPQGLW